MRLPRFYIDTLDEERFVYDEEGLEFEDLEAAKAAAVDALPDMARDKLPDGDPRTFLAIVRNECGAVLLQVSLSLQVVCVGTSPDEQAQAGHRELVGPAPRKPH